MNVLSFITSQVHHNLLTDILLNAKNDEEISGLMLTGSFARGDANSGSDLDIYIILKNGYNRAFHSEKKQGILVETKYSDFDKAMDRLRINHMEVYNYLEKQEGNISLAK